MGRAGIILILGSILCARMVLADTRVLLVGDVMLDRTVATRMKTAKDPLYPFRHVLPLHETPIGHVDFVVGNLEGPIVTKKRPPVKEIDFGFATSTANGIRRVGFDAVSQANNHTLDQGRDGAKESKTFLLQAGVLPFGDQTKESATSSFAWIEKNGKRIALVGFNVTDHLLNKQAALQVIGTATSTNATTIVFMHWGTEYRARPSNAQIELAHWFIDAGVSAVIGTHPHWVQSVEMYHGRPIAYSLGNFVFDQDWSAETRNGLAVALNFGSTTTMSLLPVSIERSQPRYLAGKEKEKRLQHLAEISGKEFRSEILNGTLSGAP